VRENILNASKMVAVKRSYIHEYQILHSENNISFYIDYRNISELNTEFSNWFCTIARNKWITQMY